MKKSKIFLLGIFLILISGLFFSSCTKKSDEVDETSEAISDTNFTETDEDLLNVDYKEFYDELAPHGEWVQVDAKDLGIKMKGSGAGSKGGSGSIINDLLGIRSAYADDVDFGMFFVWRPSPNLAVSVVAGEPAPYVPYSNGQWVNTDAGWYFQAATPYENVTCHYGRWVYSPALGWIWVPGRVWAPAWVEYRETETYVAWTPIPPGFYFVNHVIIAPPIYDVDRYIIVEKRHFCEPGVYKYMYKEHKNKIMIKEWSKVGGVTVMKKTVINKGPDVVSIEKHYGKKIEMSKINKVGDRSDAGYKDGKVDVYNRSFKKVKSTSPDKKVSTKPDKFVSFDDVKKESGSDMKEVKKEEKGRDVGKEKSGKEKMTKEDDTKGKSNDKFKGSKKLGDDRDMKKGEKMKEKGSQDKGKHEKINQDRNNKQNKEKSNDSKGKDQQKGKGRK